MSTTKTGFIVLRSNNTKVLGVQDQQAGANVVLVDSDAPGFFNLWTIDLVNNSIVNGGSGGTLAMQFQNDDVASQTPLVLGTLPASGTPTSDQQWSFLYRPGFITSMANTSLVVDNSFRGGSAGNEIWAFTFNGSPAQQWQFSDPFQFLEVQAAA